MTSHWVLWNTLYTLFLKKCLWSFPGLSMYLSERINWIISSFPHRISKILFGLGSWGNFESLGCRIGTGYFFWYLNFWKNTVHCIPWSIGIVFLYIYLSKFYGISTSVSWYRGSLDSASFSSVYHQKNCKNFCTLQKVNHVFYQPEVEISRVVIS